MSSALDAVERGHASRINELIQIIFDDFPVLSSNLQKSVDNFNFAAITAQLDVVLK